MTGFIRGLFGSKQNQADSAAQQPDAPASEARGAYFLDPDDAKTYGDINYMRMAKTVKRSFPKTVGNQGGFSLTKQVSAMEGMTNPGDMNGSAPTPSPMPASSSQNGATPQPAFKSPNEAEARRKTDTSMDMFRNMARDIRKK